MMLIFNRVETIPEPFKTEVERRNLSLGIPDEAQVWVTPRDESKPSHFSTYIQDKRNNYDQHLEYIWNSGSDYSKEEMDGFKAVVNKLVTAKITKEKLRKLYD